MARVAAARSRDQRGKRSMVAGLSHCRATIVNVPHLSFAFRLPGAYLSAMENRENSGQTYSEPRLAINRVYTRHGDGGRTRLASGQEVPKDDPRIEAYGTVDELNAFVGAARQSLLEVCAGTAGAKAQNTKNLEELGETLLRVQHELFNLGSILATLPEDVHPRQPRIAAADVTRLEEEMDACQEKLAPLRSF